MYSPLEIDFFLSHPPECPVIFTTAYQEYAVDAFRVNSVDYLLKPVRRDDLIRALNKFSKQRPPKEKLPAETLQMLLRSVKDGKNYKTRFLVKYKQSLLTVFVEDIRYFFVEDEITFLMTREGKKYAIEQTLNELAQLLDPDIFFRISRQRIVSVESVKTIHPYFNNRLLLELAPPSSEEVIVSREKTAEFKRWLENA